MKADDIAPSLPWNPLPYIVEFLMEIGPVLPAGMSIGKIEWRDIAAWQDVTGIELEPWEARMIRRLSADYLSEMRRAEKPDAPAPFTEEDQTEARREAVARKVENAFKALMLARGDITDGNQGGHA